MRLLDILLGGMGLAAIFVGYTAFIGAAPSETADIIPARLPVIETAPVSSADISPSVRQTALLRASAELSVTSELAGRIVWINEAFRLGSRLSTGDILFELDAARLETDVRRARADVAAAEAERSRLQSELARIQTLADRNISSQASLTTTLANLAAAEASLQQREAALEAAELVLAQATVRAPFDAIVAQASVSLGQFIQPGTEIGRLMDARSAELFVGLNAEQLDAIQTSWDLIGQSVTVTSAGGSDVTKPATIERVALTTDAATQTVNVVVRVDDPFPADEEVFRVGALYEVSIPLPAPDTSLLAVPVAAVQTGDRVWTVRDGTLSLVPATVGRRVGDVILLQSDVFRPGDLVVITRLPNAIEGLRVRVAGPAAAIEAADAGDRE